MSSNQPGASRLRPDLATALGLVVGVGSILAGLVLEGGSLRDVRQVTAALIVLGGTIGAVLISTPLEVFLGAVRELGKVFTTAPQPFAPTLDLLIHFADRARRNGLASLEDEAAAISDPFLRKGMELAVDGSDIREIRAMLELDLQAAEERAESFSRVWEAAAGYAPTIGIIGAVLGLIQVMKNLQNLEEVGRGIAVAFVATVYGVASANLFFLPAAAKLRTRARDRSRLQEMMMEGITAIAEGLNPKLIRTKLAPSVQEPRAPEAQRSAPMMAQMAGERN